MFLFLYLLMKVQPSDWVWESRQQEYEQMMIGVYDSSGIFFQWAFYLLGLDSSPAKG